MKKSVALLSLMVVLAGCMHLDERGIETKDTSRVNQPGETCTFLDENGQMRRCIEDRYTRNTPTDYTTGVLEDGKPVAIMNNNANKTVFVYAPMDSNCSSGDVMVAEKTKSVVVSAPDFDEESTFIVQEKPVVIVSPEVSEMKISEKPVVIVSSEVSETKTSEKPVEAVSLETPETKISEEPAIAVSTETSEAQTSEKSVIAPAEETTETVEKKWWTVSTKKEEKTTEEPKNIGRPCPCEDINKPCPECFDK